MAVDIDFQLAAVDKHSAGTQWALTKADTNSSCVEIIDTSQHTVCPGWMPRFSNRLKSSTADSFKLMFRLITGPAYTAGPIINPGLTGNVTTGIKR